MFCPTPVGIGRGFHLHCLDLHVIHSGFHGHDSATPFRIVSMQFSKTISTLPMHFRYVFCESLRNSTPKMKIFFISVLFNKIIFFDSGASAP